MNVTFSKEEILSNEKAQETLVNILADSKHGGFMRVNGFQSKGGHGEIQNTTYCKGISYENAIKKSAEMLRDIEGNKDFEVSIVRGVWKDADGNISPTNRKNKIFTIADTVKETYSFDSVEMKEAIEKVRKGLENPRPTKEYKKLGNGVYVDESTDTVYLRDLRLVSKTVVIKGDYPFKASGAVTAVKGAIEKTMPIGKYRMFRLDADYTQIALGGVELSQVGTMSGSTEQGKTATTQDVTETATTETATATAPIS